jgi:hypothetical protein
MPDIEHGWRSAALQRVMGVPRTIGHPAFARITEAVVVTNCGVPVMQDFGHPPRTCNDAL